MTNFYNPETLKNNHWLHTKKVISTSLFKNAAVFTTDTPSIVSVTVSPQESTVSAGLDVQLGAIVKTKGFANKAVVWSVQEAKGEVTKVTVDQNGLVKIPKDFPSTEEAPQITIRATSVYDNTKYGEATITVV